VTEVSPGLTTEAVGTPSSTSPVSVHLLIVHGVGRHDRLANLLRAYQTLRANLTSAEAPMRGEDQIPGWRLTRFEEGASPPFLKLEPRVEPQPGSVGAVYLYEVNYSSFAGVIRQNHPIDLTALFVGLDLAVCAARQRPNGGTSVLGGDTVRLGRCLQRASGVLAAATVPIVGLPSLLLRRYAGAFIATFARFFEDVSTFALDKNGERLISAHFDRTVATIAANIHAGDRFVLAAHSLGSVVAHNFVVRHWTAGTSRVPETFITFGSPIGLLAWAWLFLDFNNMTFQEPVDTPYFCWNPVSNRRAGRQAVSWINVVNCVDPIATVFPTAAVDLSASSEDIASGLTGGAIVHKFLGPAKVRAVGRAHTEYFNDKEGFVAILLREAGLAPSDEDVSDVRSLEAHWTDTESVLRRVQWGVYALALLAVTAYCGIIAGRFGDVRALWVVPLFAWPAFTIGLLTFCQRLLMGGPTKRVTTDLIRHLRLFNSSSLPYRLREAVLSLIGLSRDVDPMQPSPGGVARTISSAISFLPALVAMLIPIGVVAWLTGHWPTAESAWFRLWTLEGLLALALFMLYVICCAAYELIRTWREALRILSTS
jgi:hypothetical protein